MPYIIKNPFTKKRDRTADDSQYNKYRRTSVKTYDTTRWKRVRRDFLYKNPLCEECLKLGIIKAAELVHHRIPIKNGGAEYDYSNLFVMSAITGYTGKWKKKKWRKLKNEKESHKCYL